MRYSIPLASLIIFGVAASACGAPAQNVGPAIGRSAAKTRTQTSARGPAIIVKGEDLRATGLPQTGDALRRSIPQSY